MTLASIDICSVTLGITDRTRESLLHTDKLDDTYYYVTKDSDSGHSAPECVLYVKLLQ